MGGLIWSASWRLLLHNESMKYILRNLVVVLCLLVCSQAFAEIDQGLIQQISAQDRLTIKSLVLAAFTAPQDRAYFEKMEKHYTPLGLRVSASQNKGKISIYGQGRDVVLSDLRPAERKFKINGQEFQLETGKSLEIHIAKVVAILADKKNGAASFFWLGTPVMAATSVETTGIKALFYVLPAAMAGMNNISIQSGLDAVLELCQKSEGPGSKTHAQMLTRLKFIESKGGFSLEKQDAITDCKTWAQQQPFAERYEAAFVKRCETGRQVAECVKKSMQASSSKTSPVQMQPATR